MKYNMKLWGMIISGILACLFLSYGFHLPVLKVTSVFLGLYMLLRFCTIYVDIILFGPTENND
jgi:uncharacterized membrane protein